MYTANKMNKNISFPYELYSIINFIILLIINYFVKNSMLYNNIWEYLFIFFTISYGIRCCQLITKVKLLFNLVKTNTFKLTFEQVATLTKDLYLGQGFMWTTEHSALLEKIKSDSLLQKFLRSVCQAPKNFVAYDCMDNLSYKKQTITIEQQYRNTHTLILGTTRVGKTNLQSLLISQDICSKKAVIIIDPKGDLDLLRNIYATAISANRIKQLQVFHIGFPQESLNYFPLASYDNISDLASRITDILPATGENKIFRDFAWTYLNQVIQILTSMNINISFTNILFYLNEPKYLCIRYLNYHIKNIESNFIALNNNNSTDDILNCIHQFYCRIDKKQQKQINSLKAIILLDMKYYQKIIANAKTILEKIVHSHALKLINTNEGINLKQAIKENRIVYFGLDSMSNSNISKLIGMAVIADLVAIMGSHYKFNEHQKDLCLYVDEFSEIVNEKFITLLNKGGGTGLKISVAAQTISDIEVGLHSSAATAMLLGNINNFIFMRIQNSETAKILMDKLADIFLDKTSSTTNINQSMNNDYSYAIGEQNRSAQTNLINMNHLVTLPIGSAFLFNNHGKLFKFRIPQIKQQIVKLSIKQLIAKINKSQLATKINNVFDQENNLIINFNNWLEQQIINEGKEKINIQYFFFNTIIYSKKILFIDKLFIEKYAQECNIKILKLIRILINNKKIKEKIYIIQNRKTELYAVKNIDFELHNIHLQPNIVEINEVKISY